MSARTVTSRYLWITFVYTMAANLPIAVMVLHMADRGLGIGLIGLVFAIRAVLVVLLEVPTGGLADAIGRKPTALLSQGIAFLSLIALWLVTGPATALLFALLQGVGAALSSGSLDAWYVDALKRADPDADLQANLARVGMVSGAGLLVGATLGGLLPAALASVDLPWALSGFGVTLFASVLVRVVALAMTVALVHEPPRPAVGDVAGLAAVPAILRDAARLSRSLPVLRYLILGMVMGGVALGAIETFWQPVARAVLPPDAAASGAYGLLGALVGVAVLAGSAAVLRFGRLVPGGSAGLAFGGSVATGLGLLTLALQDSTFGLVAGLALAYVAISATLVPHDTMLNDAVPDERRSVMLSVNSLASFLGLTLGNGLLGWLAAAQGPRAALLVAGALTLVGSVVYLGAGRVLRRNGAPVPGRAGERPETREGIDDLPVVESPAGPPT